MFECCDKLVHDPNTIMNVPTYQPTYAPTYAKPTYITTHYLTNTSRISLRLVNRRCE